MTQSLQKVKDPFPFPPSATAFDNSDMFTARFLLPFRLTVATSPVHRV